MNFIWGIEGEKEENGTSALKNGIGRNNLDVTWKGVTYLSVISSSSMTAFTCHHLEWS